MTLAHRRGGGLKWYTRDTGSVWCSPDDSVHFGVNRVGLVNVFAKDIALLPEWEQQIWAGFNVGPDGGVSEELLASQMRSEPADTQAPEPFLSIGLGLLAVTIHEQFGVTLLKSHNQTIEIMQKCHRFRAVDTAGLFALSKDLARITADAIDASVIHKLLGLDKKDRPGSLKSLERLIATRIDGNVASRVMGPLFGIYELRLADAHLPSSDVLSALKLVGVARDAAPIQQGLQLLCECVSSIYEIVHVLRNTYDKCN